MLLRLILVSVVSAMGLNLPSARDWDDWTASGRAWIQEAIAQADAFMPAGELAFEAPAPAAATPVAQLADPAATPDWVFEAIVDQMASTFANPPAPVADVVAQVESAATAVAPPEEDAVPALVAPATAEPVAVAQLDAAEPVVPAATRSTRIDLALKLTREAMGAWTRVFEPAPQVASLSR